MSTFFYNGITINPVYTERCQRRFIWDGPTYLYTRWVIHIRGIFNPAQTSYTTEGDNINAPVKQSGRIAAYTDASVRHMLGQARGVLVYTAAGNDPMGNPLQFPGTDSQTILVVPAPQEGAATFARPSGSDANFGPIPLHCDVTRIVGTRTFWVDFVIQTDVNECYRVYSAPSLVLSNRWEMTHDVDEHHFTRRIVQGRAIFRTDMMLPSALRPKALRPDDYRAAFFFPCPRNFKRQSVQVKQNKDGNELIYSFVDQEQSHNLIGIAKNVTKIDAWATISVGSEGGEPVVTNAIGTAVGGGLKGAAAGAGAGALAGAGIGTAGGPIGTVGGAVIGATSGLVYGLFSAAGDVPKDVYNALPQSRLAIHVRVWGNRQSTRSELESVASKVIALKLPSLGQQQAGGFQNTLFTAMIGKQFSATYNLMGRYVEIHAAIKMRPITSALVAPGAFLHAFNAAFPELIQDDIPGIAVINGPPGGYSMPNGEGARGTYLEVCVAQALSNICGSPPSPTYMTNAVADNKLTIPPSVTTTLATTPTGVAYIDGPVGTATLTASRTLPGR